jgi:hypothetical protein
MRFRAEVPPAARNLDYFLPTSRLKIKQNWTTRLNHIRVGDSVSRTVVVSAQKMRAMLIPPIALSAPEGVRIYQRAPSVEDQESETGEFVQGVRTETICLRKAEISFCPRSRSPGGISPLKNWSIPNFPL